MALTQPGVGNAYKAGIIMHFLDAGSTAVTHGLPQTTHQLVNQWAQHTLVRHSRFNTLGNQTRLIKYITLEVGVAFGGLLLLAGVLGTLRALSTWNESNFGELEPRRVLRIVIPSALALTLGFEIKPLRGKEFRIMVIIMVILQLLSILEEDRYDNL